MEPKVVGPLTLKQFIIVSLGTTVSFAVYFSLGGSNMPLALALIVIVELIACAAAFLKIGAPEDVAAKNAQTEGKGNVDPAVRSEKSGER